MICICRKLSRGWNNFELMISICRKLSSGRNPKKKVPTLAQLFQPPTNCKPVFAPSHLCMYVSSSRGNQSPSLESHPDNDSSARYPPPKTFSAPFSVFRIVLSITDKGAGKKGVRRKGKIWGVLVVVVVWWKRRYRGREVGTVVLLWG